MHKETDAFGKIPHSTQSFSTTVLCLCVLLCVSVSLCAVSLCPVRSVGPLNRTSLHSPTQGAGGRETLVFNISRVCPQCIIARSRPSTRVQDATQCIVSRMVSLFSFINSCSGCNPVHRVQDGQFVLVHQLVFRMQPSASCPGWSVCSRSSTRRRACRVDQLVLVQSRRVQDATQCIVSRMVQHAEVYNQSLHQLTFVMK